MWPRFGPGLVYFIYLFSWLTCGLLMADRPSAIIIHSMWAGARCWIWARIKINVAQIWASSALFGLFMADIGPSFGLLAAQNWQTGADCPSAIILHSMWARARCWIWARSGPELKLMRPRFGPVLLYLVYSWLKLGLPLAYFWPRCGPDLDLRNFAIWV